MNHLIEKYRPQIRRALSNFQFEREPGGTLLLPKLGLRLGGVFMHDVNGSDKAIDGNLVVNQGLDYILGSALAQGSQLTALYIAPFSGNVDPASTLTAATFTATMTEFTNYTQSARVAWAKDAEASQQIGNTTTPAAFTIGTGGGTIWGAGLLSASAKSSTSGTLVACGKFAAARVLSAADALNLTYLFTASDAS
jgi:hypothetical protein